MITVQDLIEMMLEKGNIDIYLNDKTYRFDMDDIPDEIAYANIDTIDNPDLNEKVRPLCINISNDEFDKDELEEFEKEYKNHIIS